MHLDPRDIKSLRGLFANLDANNTGVINFQELCVGLPDISKHDAKALFTELDQACTGSITFTDFLVAAMERSIFRSTERLHEAFALLDYNGDGKLEQEDLYRILDTFHDDSTVA